MPLLINELANLIKRIENTNAELGKIYCNDCFFDLEIYNFKTSDYNRILKEHMKENKHFNYHLRLDINFYESIIEKK